VRSNHSIKVPIKNKQGVRIVRPYNFVAAHASSGQLVLLHVPYRIDADLLESAEVEGNHMQRSVLEAWRGMVMGANFASSASNMVAVRLMPGVQQVVSGLRQLAAQAKAGGRG
jgi:hypothetical protein